MYSCNISRGFGSSQDVARGSLVTQAQLTRRDNVAEHVEVSMVAGAQKRIRDIAKEQKIQRFRKALREASLEQTHKAQLAYEKSRRNTPVQKQCHKHPFAPLWQLLDQKPVLRNSLAALFTTFSALGFAGMSQMAGCHMTTATRHLQAAPLDGATKMMFEVAIGLVLFVAASGSGIAAYRLITRNFEVDNRQVASVSLSFSVIYIAAMVIQQNHFF